MHTQTGGKFLSAIVLAGCATWMLGSGEIATAATLYGSHNSGFSGTNDLVTIDKSTGDPTDIGPMNYNSITGLTYSPDSNTLFGVRILGELISINPTTGAGTLIGSTGYNSVDALTYDTSTNTLYGMNNSTDELISIDTATGAASAVGSMANAPFNNVKGMAYDPFSDTLYGVGTLNQSSTMNLFEIDRSDASITDIGAVGASYIVTGLTFDTDTSTLYGVSSAIGTSLTDMLISIDTSTGAGSDIATLGTGTDYGTIEGLTAANISTVPLPAAAWLFGSGLLGLFGVARRK